MMNGSMKPYQDQTYYELLEVPVTASENEIRAAYERASELFAPDSVAIYALENPAQADDLRARLREAMEILTDADLREEYDRSIGVTRRGRPERVAADDEREPSAAAVVAANEVLAPPSAVHSTHPEFAVSYVPPPEGMKAEPPPPRTEPDSTPVREAMPFGGYAEPPRSLESPRVPEPVRPEPGYAAEPPRSAEPLRAAEPVRAVELARSAEPLRVPESARAVEPPRPVEPREPVRPTSRPAKGMEATQLAEESAIATAEAALAQVSAKARETRPKPIDLPPDAEFNGELLRRIRESRGLTLAQVSERTRISTRHLENVEADRYKDLPALVYLRGILMNLAREYGLDALRVSKSYLTLAGKKA